MRASPPIEPSPFDDAFALALAQVLPMLYPTRLRSGDVAYLLDRFADRRARSAQRYPSPGWSADWVAQLPSVAAFAAPAMEGTLRWLDATALLDGPRPVLLSRRLEAMVAAIVDAGGVVLSGRREKVVDHLTAAAEPPSHHECPALLDAIADALAEAIAV